MKPPKISKFAGEGVGKVGEKGFGAHGSVSYVDDAAGEVAARRPGGAAARAHDLDNAAGEVAIHSKLLLA